MVARQPAVELSLLLSVTVYTESHLEINWDQSVIFLHIPVTGDTINLTPDMGLMAKFDMVWNVIDPDPGDRGLCIRVPFFLHNFRVLRNDIRVTKEAQTHRWDACILRTLCVGMTESATDLFHASMNPVAKIDGLSGADGPLGIEIVEIDHPQQKKGQGE